MGRIILAPNNTVSVTNWTGLPTTGPTILNLNVDELLQSPPDGSAPGDGDASYCYTTSSPATVRFGFPNLSSIGDYTHYLIAYPEYGYRYPIEPPAASSNNEIKLYKDGNLVSGTPWIISSTGSWQQIDDVNGTLGSFLRFPVEYEKSDAESSDWEIEFIATSPTTLRLTSLQLVFHTGYSEDASGGAKLGGSADLGNERQARVGVKLGGKISNNFVYQPLGGILVASDFKIKHYNNAHPLIKGGAFLNGTATVVNFIKSKKPFKKKTFNINSDLVFTYSGGKLNNTSSGSIGGSASPIIIRSGLNNLFSDISPTVLSQGRIDYRCFYIFNDHEDETIYNIKNWISSEVEKGSSIRVGIDEKNELQTVTLDSVPTSGYFTVQYESSNPLGYAPVKINYNSDLNIWANNFKNALRSNPDLRDVSVTASLFGSGVLFEVLFEGLDGKRKQEILKIVNNSLSPDTNISVKKIVNGSPINSTASFVNQDTTPPGGVIFYYPVKGDSLNIPKLREGEGYHLWIERTITSENLSIENDGFSLGVSIEPIEPPLEEL